MSRYYPQFDNMKLTLLITLTAWIGCSEVNPQTVNFSDYQYPTNQLSEEKVFVYQKVNSIENNRSYKHKSLVKIKGNTGISSVQRNGEVKFDSAITSAEKPFKLLEIYRFDYDSLSNYLGYTKGSIEKDIRSGDIICSISRVWEGKHCYEKWQWTRIRYGYSI